MPGRGRLTILVAPGPGAGKTTALLAEARRLQAGGAGVVVAAADPRGRTDIAAALAGLEVVPARRVEDAGLVVEEMDLGAVVARRPAVAIVDDLERRHSPVARHPRRSQDVEALQAEGIDVVTAVDILQIDSLGDLIEQLTGLTVRDTVSDRLLRGADELVSVDIATDVWLARRSRLVGPGRPEWFLDALFKPEILDALRELALREVAGGLARRAPAAAPRRPEDRVMVCLSSFSPRSMTLLRRGARLAGRLNTGWFVVYVETPGERPDRLSPEVQRQLSESVARAKELGAEVVFLKASDPAPALLDFARSHAVAHLILGRSARGARRWFRPALAETLLRASEGLDVYVLASATEDRR